MTKSLDKVLRTSAFAMNGDSGGPIFNSDYKLIGIIHAIAADLNEKPIHGISYGMALNQFKNEDFKLHINEPVIPNIPFMFLKFNEFVEIK